MTAPHPRPAALSSCAVRIGVLTGGGDCPGLNAVIRAIVRKGIDGHGHAIVGFRDGWRGPLENAYEELTIESTRGILPRGGTILRSSRTNPFKPRRRARPDRREHAHAQPRGADRDRRRGHARARPRACTPSMGCRSSGVPKTIDNDLGGTDMTFGFDTAVQIATDAIDRLHTTAESHNRVMIVEVMGRHAGWIALHSGLAGGADVILIPERPFDIDEVVRLIRRRHSRGRFFSIVVVAEGATPRRARWRSIGGSQGRVRPRAPGRDRPAAGARDRARAPASRRAPPCSATSSAAARPPPSTGCWPRGSGWPRSTPPRAGAGARCRPCAAPIELVPLGDAVAQLRTVPDEEYAAAEAFFG